MQPTSREPGAARQKPADCGVAISPDVVTAQIEGAIGFALSAALRNQVTLNNCVIE